MLNLALIRKALETALHVGILRSCICNTPWETPGGIKCGHCLIRAALDEIDRALRHGRRQKDPTYKDRELILFITRYQKQHGYPPSMQEMATAVGWTSASNVARHLDKLQLLGYVQRERYRARSIRVLKLPGAP